MWTAFSAAYLTDLLEGTLTASFYSVLQAISHLASEELCLSHLIWFIVRPTVLHAGLALMQAS